MATILLLLLCAVSTAARGTLKLDGSHLRRTGASAAAATGRGDKFPYYCSKDVRRTRAVPPLSAEAMAKSPQLAQIQMVIRHGARTPDHSSFCWDNYDIRWNCSLTMGIRGQSFIPSQQPVTLASVLPPSLPNDTATERGHAQTRGLEMQDMPTVTEQQTFLFPKVYDSYPNVLGGTCQEGQLIEEGMAQHAQLGKLVRQAYLSAESGSNASLSFLPLVRMQREQQGSGGIRVYFRSDDVQRTLLSGATLLTYFLKGREGETEQEAGEIVSDHPVLHVHTGDYRLDTMYPNDDVCPRLKELKHAARNSEPCKQWRDSDEQKAVLESLREIPDIGGPNYHFSHHLMDCLFTATCTEHRVPRGLEWSADSLFARYVGQVEKEEAACRFSANDAAYSKLAATPVIHDMRQKAAKGLSEAQRKSGGERSPPTAPHIALWSGHDTTLMPVLAAMGAWDGKWPSYASIIILELYTVGADSREAYFRLIYNGEVITSMIKGCDPQQDLCSYDHFDAVTSFAKDGPDCDPTEPPTQQDTSPIAPPPPLSPPEYSSHTNRNVGVSDMDEPLASADIPPQHPFPWTLGLWLLLCVACAIVGGFLGAGATLAFVRKTSRGGNLPPVDFPTVSASNNAGSTRRGPRYVELESPTHDPHPFDTHEGSHSKAIPRPTSIPDHKDSPPVVDRRPSKERPLMPVWELHMNGTHGGEGGEGAGGDEEKGKGQTDYLT
ncbi:unnamed protein product [Vitrella brassicaformis CCMP3155]|uniref:Uncharacterized protein n=3 Tax=Vitrella brassicaformis TaxID=1169539 RepID=A0A0G4H6F4_VITBC|nr:unnamed protein product [Vitrella brassicaformis CCMP3155]|eukprot:CEM39194.1 unnamed protein product [Vitrella brassicaformis CCMP3155]